jgi:hypothetical protein
MNMCVQELDIVLKFVMLLLDNFLGDGVELLDRGEGVELRIIFKPPERLRLLRLIARGNFLLTSIINLQQKYKLHHEIKFVLSFDSDVKL